jgi:hypothetical protein
MISEYYKSELDLSRQSNDGKEDYWKELFRQSKYREWETSYAIWHDELPGIKLIYLN